MTALKRARGAFVGLAVGDALGMPTQCMSPTDITDVYGHITGLVAGSPCQPIAANMPAGSITDDTEQALLVARHLADEAGTVVPRRFADELMAWETDMAARGSLDLLGPSTKAAIEAVRAGVVPCEAGTAGTTNGAAMRITPVGVCCSVRQHPQRLVSTIHAACLVTHNTTIALGAAGFVAGAVSAGVDGLHVTNALDIGIEIAARAEKLGHWQPGGSVPARVTALRPLSANLTDSDFEQFITEVVGTSVASQESVVATALIVEHYSARPWEGLLFCARIGGDTDTIAAMAGAIFGATQPDTVCPAEAATTVLERNGLELNPLIHQLVSLRTQD